MHIQPYTYISNSKIVSSAKPLLHHSLQVNLQCSRTGILELVVDSVMTDQVPVSICMIQLYETSRTYVLTGNVEQVTDIDSPSMQEYSRRELNPAHLNLHVARSIFLRSPLIVLYNSHSHYYCLMGGCHAVL